MGDIGGIGNSIILYDAIIYIIIYMQYVMKTNTFKLQNSTFAKTSEKTLTICPPRTNIFTEFTKNEEI